MLATELFAALDPFDFGHVLCETLRAILGRKIRLVIAIDSQTVFHVLIKLAKTTEKRLLIDAAVLKQAYDMHEISDIVLISGQSTPADVLTKAKSEAS